MSHPDRVSEIIRAVLDWDEQPPDADYSPSEYGEQVGRSMSPSELRELAAAALQGLPASLAISFLEGVCESAPPFLSQDLLYDQIRQGHSVDTAGVVVELLCVVCNVEPDRIAAELLRRLQTETDTETQDRLSYAIWVLFFSECLLIREDRFVGYLVSPIDDEIDELLAHHDGLSKYTRDTLTGIRQRRAT